MQMQLNRLVDYCTENEPGKTKVTIFNTARLYDFMPRICIGEITNLEVVGCQQFVFITWLRHDEGIGEQCGLGYWDTCKG
jgi:hypothetical protein